MTRRVCPRLCALVSCILCLCLPAVAGAQLPHNVPEFCANATLRSVQSGPWTSASTWDGARVPVAGDRVSIEAGHQVSYSAVSDAVLGCVGIDGELNFSTTVNTRMTVVTMQVLPTGRLTIGIWAARVPANLKAELVIASQAPDTATDPEQYGTGLIVFGHVRMHGAEMLTPYVRLSAEPAAGHTSLSLANAPSGWRTGDRLALPDSTHWFIESTPPPETWWTRWETSTLASLAGTTATLSAPLQYAHPGARDADDVLRFLPHVANLSRSVVIRSASPTPNQARGHIIALARADIDMRYVTLKDLGRTTEQPLNNTTFDAGGNVTHIGTNQIGRYAMHYHHLMGPVTAPPNGRQFTIIGCAIDGATKWGIAIHQSSYGLVQKNVIFNSLGTGLMTEDGNEIENIIDGNFVLVVKGTGQERADARGNEYGFEGSAYWFHGPANYVRNNIGATANSFGTTYAMLGLPPQRIPNFPGADLTVPGQYTTVDMVKVPIKQDENNELYGTKNGLTVWNLMARCCETVYEGPESVFKNSRLWHISRYGYYGYGQNRTTFDGWTQYASKAGMSSNVEFYMGFFFSDYLTRNLTIRNADMQNLKTGIHVPPKSGQTTDIYGNTATPILIENSTLRNLTNVRVTTPWGITGGGTLLPPRRTIVRNIDFGGIPGKTTKDVVLQYQTGNANPNLVKLDEIRVEQPADIFRVYYDPQQGSGFVLPASGGGLVGCPAAGLTNQQCMATYGVAVGGAIAPCSTTRTTVTGFTCPTP